MTTEQQRKREQRRRDLEMVRRLEAIAQGIREKKIDLLDAEVTCGAEECSTASGVRGKRPSGEQTWTIRIFVPVQQL